MQPKQQKESGGDLASQFNIASNLAAAVSFPVEVWTTKWGTWGSRYLNIIAVLGCVWPLIFGTLCGPHRRIMDLFQFWQLTLGLLVIHRIAGLIRRRRGYRCHSRYWGDSWLERGTGENAHRRARNASSLLVCVIGCLFCSAGSEPLGMFLLISGAAKILTDGLAFQATEMRLQQMEDARIDNEYYSGLFRERQR